MTIWDIIKEMNETNDNKASIAVVSGHGGDVSIDLLFDSYLEQKDGITALFLMKDEALQIMESLINLFPDEAEEILENI